MHVTLDTRLERTVKNAKVSLNDSNVLLKNL